MKKNSSVVFYISALILLSLTCCNFSWANKTPHDWALLELDYARKEKALNLNHFMKKLHDLARQSVKDENVVSFFEMNRQLFNINPSQDARDFLVPEVQKLRQHFDSYYLSNYYAFYDILFIDTKGNVFYSIRKELDFHCNLIQNKEKTGRLGEAVSKKPAEELFVDFYQYEPSSEPASFFLEPVQKDGVHVGWLALQCAINKLNSIFSSTDDLGQTGETFLVNSAGLMLTESHFKGYSTILKEHLDDRNIKAKFQEGKGHRLVTDYRGYAALTSFETFGFLNTKWLVVAKIDRDEVTTNYYELHRKYYAARLTAYLQENQKPSRQINYPVRKNALRVDMDEFLKAGPKELLETWGVSTCTALVAYTPGKFGYLAHISPKDRVYNHHETNLVSQITKKIKSFDIYPSEMRNVNFLIVSPHLDTLPAIVDQLISDGFLLSQIQVAFSKDAKNASIVFNYALNSAVIKWSLHEGNNAMHTLTDAVNIGSAMEYIMENENKLNNSMDN